jgi:hypothetical protein
LEQAGNLLYQDDIADVGWGKYSAEQRPHHKDTAPGLHAGRPGDHPSILHHYQLGIALKALGIILQGGKRP